MIYGREKVSYDLEKQENFRSAGRPLGWYYATDEVGYRMQIEGGFLKSLNITVKVFPVIQLWGIDEKKTKKCARKSILEHERRHSAVAKWEFKKLANDIKKNCHQAVHRSKRARRQYRGRHPQRRARQGPL
jgi:hypothetical protein